MRKCFYLWSVGLSSALLIGLLSSTARAQDPVKVAPNNYKVVFENDFVRVCEVKAKPGEEIAMHSHPDHAVYSVTDNKVKFSYPDGKTKDVDLKAGEATWIKAETHATKNIGAAELKVVVFELKKAVTTSPKPKIPDTEDQAKVAAESTKVLLDNERLRFLDARIKPGGKIAKHSHPNSVVYALTETKAKVTTYPDGKTEDKTLTAGQAFWSAAVTHAVENVGPAEVHHLIVELKE